VPSDDRPLHLSSLATVNHRLAKRSTVVASCPAVTLQVRLTLQLRLRRLPLAFGLVQIFESILEEPQEKIPGIMPGLRIGIFNFLGTAPQKSDRQQFRRHKGT
jgi:hypothetical protein